MDEQPIAAYIVNIAIDRLDASSQTTCEEARMERYDVKALHKCPDCGWLNYTVENWGDGEIYCENPACGRIRKRSEEDYGEGSGYYIHCATCARWYPEALFPRHLIAHHLKLPGESPYDIIPGQEGK